MMRPIAPIELPEVVPQTPPTAMPELTFINPRDVLVNEKYQRNLSVRSIDLIARIVGKFDWRRWRPPVCVWGEGGLMAIDGQHSLIAAASHPGITEVPVLIVSATTLAEQATMFIGVNSDRLAVTKRQLHAAAVAAEDPSALVTQGLCDRLGIRLLKTSPNAKARYAPRETCAVSSISDMVTRIGVELAEVVLQVLVDAACAPIKQIHLMAAEHLLIDPEFSGQISAAELAATIVALGEAGEKEGRIFAATHSVPQWRGLASVWFQKRKRSRPAPRVTQFDPVEGKFGPGFKSVLPDTRVIDRRPNGPVSLGDPEPGRSALDERRRATA